MRNMPDCLGPLERALVNLLGRLPLRWERLDVDALTATEQEALKRLARAGLIEQRIRLRAWMAGFSETLRMQVRVSGEYRSSDVIRRMFDAVPEWLDSRGRTRGRFRLESDGVVEVRLTDQGEQARYDWEHNSPQTPSFVLAFVAGIGPMGLPRPRVKGSVIVESCRLEPSEADEVPGETTGDEPQPPPSGGRAAAGSGGAAPASPSRATATVGDVTVHNHLHLDQGAVVESVLRRLSEQQAAAQTRPPGEAPSTPSAVPAAPEGTGDQPTEDDEDPFDRLPRRVRRAYGGYLVALRQCEAEAGGPPTDRQLYAWLKHRSEERLPAFETWVRYIRQARQALGEQKNSPRAGRQHGTSIVSCHDIEPLPHGARRTRPD